MFRMVFKDQPLDPEHGRPDRSCLRQNIHTVAVRIDPSHFEFRRQL